MINFDHNNPLTTSIVKACRHVPAPNCIGVICHRAGTGAMATEAIVSDLISQGVILETRGRYEVAK